ncbi:MAG: RNA pseudouridine synthase, partial [Candidatus Shikimatogenerans sp. JK-2022]|nr:RNA pseudouridine synthase [Candidatus Shikimatogenerans bostrichidophilus]
MYKHIIKTNLKIRIDKYLSNFYFKTKISRRLIQIYINKGLILLNKKKIKKKIKIKINDIIIFKKKILLKNNKNKMILPNNKLKVNIHYEDNNIIIINKNPGIVVHPGCGYYKNTVINWLKYYINKQKIKTNLNYNNYRYGLLHRLDKNTSGLLMIAKNIKTYNSIKNQFFNKTIIKKYIALIWGIPKKKTNVIKNYIGRNKKKRIKMMVVNNKKDGKYSITKYKILKTFKYFSLIKCYLKTGRTHQIRVHLKYIGHPIFNDDLYGGNKNYINKKIINYKKINKLFKILPRQALHAYYLSYKDPIT